MRHRRITYIACCFVLLMPFILYYQARITSAQGSIFGNTLTLGTTELISRAVNNTTPNENSDQALVSVDGRYVSYASAAGNIVPEDTNNVTDVFVYDRTTRQTERVSSAPDGSQLDTHVRSYAMAADGHHLIFLRDVQGTLSLFAHNRKARTTRLVVDHEAWGSSISADGRYISFAGVSNADSMDKGQQVYIFDQNGTLTQLPFTKDDKRKIYSTEISGNGRVVAFVTTTHNSAPNPPDAFYQLYLYDLDKKSFELVSVSADGSPGGVVVSSLGRDYSLSFDGRYVAFSAYDTLIGDESNSWRDVMLRDRELKATVRISKAPDGTQGNYASHTPVFSSDGRYISFISAATNLVPDKTTSHEDVFVYDQHQKRIERVSIAANGLEANNGTQYTAAISGDGRYVAFTSNSSNLTNNSGGVINVFLRDRGVIYSDNTPPAGRIISPKNGSVHSMAQEDMVISADASDNSGGSGIKEVEFNVLYNGSWKNIGTDDQAPYEITWTIPSDLASQSIAIHIHITDHAGNTSFGHDTVQRLSIDDLRSKWVANRAYLNQLALGIYGDRMCSMASIAMVRAQAGLIQNTFESLKTEAENVWNTGMRGPGVGGVKNYLNRNGMKATVIWTQDKDAHWIQITQEIDAGRALILNSQPAEFGGKLTAEGHYVVVVGYRNASSKFDRQLIVYDPYGHWTGITSRYTRSVNKASPDPPDGTMGRWVFYNFNDLGTIYSVKAERVAMSSVAEVTVSPPDEIFKPLQEEVVTYLGVKQEQYVSRIYLPLLNR